MQGQLYQECEKFHCNTEPVCAGCEFCEAHCQCPSPAEIKADEARRKATALISEGYKTIENYIREFGERCEHPTGNTIADTRVYIMGAGYSSGSVFAIDQAGAIYLTVHTGSNVPEWATQHYILPEIDDPAEGDNYTNASIVEALAGLADGRPLRQEQRVSFGIA